MRVAADRHTLVRAQSACVRQETPFGLPNPRPNPTPSPHPRAHTGRAGLRTHTSARARAAARHQIVRPLRYRPFASPTCPPPLFRLPPGVPLSCLRGMCAWNESHGGRKWKKYDTSAPTQPMTPPARTSAGQWYRSWIRDAPTRHASTDGNETSAILRAGLYELPRLLSFAFGDVFLDSRSSGATRLGRPGLSLSGLSFPHMYRDR
mmetsp:Transcript_2045/g.4682  ORF Transcript_2045/g.4682 Transcript_2045/m.4682 type:complete len:206 (+) Transcript_2045:88-705(+)